jgi:hypothetical protein
VRIGDPARGHQVADADMWHALRNATRMVSMDETLTMLIGPARDGSMSRSAYWTSRARTRWSSTRCR